MKKVLVTGCADGIGLATANKLYKKGYEVFGFDIKNQKLETSIHFELVDINDTKKLVDYMDRLPNLDIVVNNAAVQIEKSFVNHSSSDIDLVLNTNLVSLMKLSQLVINKLNEDSIIINIGSIHSDLPRLNKLSYDVSKAGLDMFTKGLALELAPKTRVIGLNIGATTTPMNVAFKDKYIKDSAMSKVPLKHIFKPDEIAMVVLGLLHPTFKHMTGAIIKYDGGRSLK